MGNWKSLVGPSVVDGTSSSQIVSDNEEAEDEGEEEKFNEAIGEALQNPLILHKIIENMDFLDLRASRLVSKMWGSISTEILQRRDTCVVIIKYDLARLKFRQCSQRELHSHPFPTSGIREEQNLSFLNEILKKCPPANFPATHFIFFRGDLGEEEPQQFFDLQGPHIRTLELVKIFQDDDSTEEWEVSQIVKKILQIQAPHVSHLNLKDFDYKLDIKNDDDDDDNDENGHNKKLEVGLSLPALKKFFWTDVHPMTLLSLMRAASNLETTKNALLDGDLQIVRVAEKVHTVKKLYCGLCNNASDITNFSRMGPCLLDLEFSSDDLPLDVEKRRELSTAFVHLLEISKDSLQSLDLNELCYRYEILGLPQFGRLTRLKIGSGHRRRCFPQGIYLTDTFPNLKILDCSDLRGKLESYWSQYFPPPSALSPSPPFCGNLPLVTTIEIFDTCSEFFMQKLHDICPNFGNLVVHGNDTLGAILRKIFEMWQHLHSIQLRVHPFSSLGQFPNLDSAVTGLQPDVCEMLRKRGVKIQENLVEECENMDFLVKTFPNICDLQNLKIFKIIFEPHSHYEMGKFDENQIPFLSSVSGLYGFGLLDQLKVSIEFDHNFPGALAIKSAFQSVGPYVNFHHQHNFRND